MGYQFQHWAQQMGVTLDLMIMAGVGLGSLILVLGLAAILSPGKSRLRRMAVVPAKSQKNRSALPLVFGVEGDPQGMLKSLLPSEREERSRVARTLAQAGWSSVHAVRNFYLIRACIGLVLPILFLTLIYFGGVLNLPGSFGELLNGLSNIRIIQTITVLVALGFYGPTWWLRSKISARQRRIENSFPNALDLLQISVESGMGLDVAMSRVGHEMRQAAPDLADEFLNVQAEILAGQSRDKALFAMAERLGIPEAKAFVNVVLQSLQYGSSISKALATYAQEMRQQRELRAQEKANKLPVQMSGVMASMMLPALFMITLGPVAIRYIRFFGG